jgi:uncharacterized protein (DUF1810 family)
MNDPYNLSRFLQAQEDDYARALAAGLRVPSPACEVSWRQAR